MQEMQRATQDIGRVENLAPKFETLFPRRGDSNGVRSVSSELWLAGYQHGCCGEDGGALVAFAVEPRHLGSCGQFC